MISIKRDESFRLDPTSHYSRALLRNAFAQIRKTVREKNEPKDFPISKNNETIMVLHYKLKLRTLKRIAIPYR